MDELHIDQPAAVRLDGLVTDAEVAGDQLVALAIDDAIMHRADADDGVVEDELVLGHCLLERVGVARLQLLRRSGEHRGALVGGVSMSEYRPE